MQCVWGQRPSPNLTLNVGRTDMASIGQESRQFVVGEEERGGGEGGIPQKRAAKVEGDLAQEN